MVLVKVIPAWVMSMGGNEWIPWGWRRKPELLWVCGVAWWKREATTPAVRTLEGKLVRGLCSWDSREHSGSAPQEAGSCL